MVVLGVYLFQSAELTKSAGKRKIEEFGTKSASRPE
jgi:hypothetical protein